MFLSEKMESFEKLSDTFSRENQARLTATQVSINKIRTDIQSKKVAVDNAAEVTRKIQVLESQITELKSSNDYLSVQEMREFQMEIRFQETQIENLTSVQDQLKFAQRSCSFTKEFKDEVWVGWLVNFAIINFCNNWVANLDEM